MKRSGWFSWVKAAGFTMAAGPWCAFTHGAEYYLDSARGNDVTGTGTSDKPWSSWSRAKKTVRGGDVLILRDGRYGVFSEVGTGLAFSTPLIIRAEHRGLANFERIEIASGSLGAPTHLTFDGVKVDDGVLLEKVAGVSLANSFLERLPPWTGSVQNIEKSALQARDCTDISITGNEITRTATGLELVNNTRLLVSKNRIHDIAHDGIRSIGSINAVIEYNHIYGLNDGAADSDGKDWNRHADALHIFIKGGPKEILRPNDGLLIRGNLLHDAESQLVQFNNYGDYSDPELWNKNIVFANNIFGPSNNPFAVNNADPVKGLVFFNNVFVNRVSEYTSPYPEILKPRITSSKSGFRVSDQTVGAVIFNNVFWSAPVVPGSALFNDFNVIQHLDQPQPLARNSWHADSAALGFQNYEAYDLSLLPGSALVDRGIAIAELVNKGLLSPNFLEMAKDRRGVPHDERPDLGVYEVEGRSPAPFGLPEADLDAVKTVFVDDFEDGDLQADPALSQGNSIGLAWTPGVGSTNSFHVERPTSTNPLLQQNGGLNYLGGAMTNTGPSYLLAGGNFNWRNFDVEFSAQNAYVKHGAGVMFLLQDQDNFVYLDLGSEGGRLVRVQNGEKTVIAEDAGLAIAANQSGAYRISIRHVFDDTRISVTKAGSSIELASVLVPAVSGSVGFLHDSPTAFHRLLYQDIRITTFPAPAKIESSNIDPPSGS